MDNNAFFDKYEDHEGSRKDIDTLCRQCPVKKICFANGISGKEWGVWGGVYLESGEVSREFNKHKTKQDWSITWQALTME
jgi:signal transduction histidine kinase